LWVLSFSNLPQRTETISAFASIAEVINSVQQSSDDVETVTNFKHVFHEIQ